MQAPGRVGGSNLWGLGAGNRVGSQPGIFFSLKKAIDGELGLTWFLMRHLKKVRSERRPWAPGPEEVAASVVAGDKALR